GACCRSGEAADARSGGDGPGGRGALKGLLGAAMSVMGSATVLVMLWSAPGSVTGQPACGQRPAWMFGPFEKPRAVNPAIAPSPASTFLSAMSDTIVRWEEHATFNPAAVVKDGTVYLLYRAEDASGAHRIGGHTS